MWICRVFINVVNTLKTTDSHCLYLNDGISSQIKCLDNYYV